MIIITQPKVTDAQIDHIVARIEEFGLRSQVMRGENRIVIGVIGPDDLIREKPIGAIPGVEAVIPVMKPYKLVAQENGALPPPVSIGKVKIGSGQRIVLISGPCSVEGRDRLLTIATAVKNAGARVLRGGAFKPRTSPYSFQGLGEDGLRYLAEARAATGLPIITEIMDTRDLPLMEKYTDCLQIGSRNMQNFALLKEVGRSRLPVMLKRGFSATINDLLLSAEYILSEGNPNVLLCERGIRTFEPMTRNTLDLSAVPILKAKAKLPVVVDPTHGIGLREFIPQMSLAAVAAGADALMIEVHDDPERARSDGEQALQPEGFVDLVRRLRAVAEAIGREL
jgi:3-deoxy-7-phosphoheptulonate synthase